MTSATAAAQAAIVSAAFAALQSLPQSSLATLQWLGHYRDDPIRRLTATRCLNCICTWCVGDDGVVGGVSVSLVGGMQRRQMHHTSGGSFVPMCCHQVHLERNNNANACKETHQTWSQSARVHAVSAHAAAVSAQRLSMLLRRSKQVRASCPAVQRSNVSVKKR